MYVCVSVCVCERDRDRAHFPSLPLPRIPAGEAPSPHHRPSLHLAAGQRGVDSRAQQPTVGVGEITNPLPLKKLARPKKSHPRLPLSLTDLDIVGEIGTYYRA